MRRTRLGARMAAATVGVIAAGCVASSAEAATTSVYYDSNSNTSADPFPFGALTSGLLNTGLGQGPLDDVTSGVGNTGLGFGSLETLTTGSYNTAVGQSSARYGNASE